MPKVAEQVLNLDCKGHFSRKEKNKKRRKTEKAQVKL
jgi:hypothetical protein